MNVLWICNKAPQLIEEDAFGASGCFGGWLDAALEGLVSDSSVKVFVSFPDNRAVSSQIRGIEYSSFKEEDGENYFKDVFRLFRPDVIHVWGTEFPHSRAALKVANLYGMAESTVVSIQGLVSVIGKYHYVESLPPRVALFSTVRDFVKRDNIEKAAEKFVARGEAEIECIKLAKHVIGRTEWDRECVKQINPGVMYHHCGETLRATFYEGKWNPECIEKHSVFASQCSYPVKGFHLLLEALPYILKRYPDTVVYVPGIDLMNLSFTQKMKLNSYQKYLIDLISKKDLVGHVRFLGALDAEGMKNRYLKSNVFVSPSTVENSSNSIGEAMLLGCPVVASYSGGTPSIVEDGISGLLYQTNAPYMLAAKVCQIFSDGEFARRLSSAEIARAAHLHDARANSARLSSIYAMLTKSEKARESYE